MLVKQSAGKPFSFSFDTVTKLTSTLQSPIFFSKPTIFTSTLNEFLEYISLVSNTLNDKKVFSEDIVKDIVDKIPKK